MKILVVGAGAIGGYFGGRLLEAGRDVTFLVRPERSRRLAEGGLTIRSGFGDLVLPDPPTVTAAALRGRFDLVLLSCKAYDLEAAIADFAPAVGPDTAILPVVNGMGHLERLDRAFGAGRTLGGLCLISSVLAPDGTILHRNNMHGLVLGERDGGPGRCAAIAAALSGAKLEPRISAAILQEMWEKWVFIATLAGINCLMRANVGEIVAAGAGDLAVALMDECAAIASGQGFPPRAEALDKVRALVTVPGSPLIASMLGDLERGAPIEADHVIGDLLRRGGQGSHPLLRIVHAHLKAYEARRNRGN